jgi:hypothetical protein
MKKLFVTFLNELIEYNGKKILEQPDRFLGTFLDFTQNEYRAEAQVFSQFLASKQAQEIKASDDIDAVFLKAIADRFHQVSLIDKSYCELIVNAYAEVLGLNVRKLEPQSEAVEKPVENAGNTPEAVEIPVEKTANASEVKDFKPLPKKTKSWLVAVIILGIGGISVTAGIGFSQYKDMEWRYTNMERRYTDMEWRLMEMMEAQNQAETVPAPIPDGLEFEIVNGSVTITSYTGYAATVNIPGWIQGLPVTAIGYRAFYDCSSLISVTIPSSVTSIGYGAFLSYNLESITVDSRNSVYTSIDGILFDKPIQTILAYPAGKQARVFDIPTYVTAIGDVAFFSCYNLISVSIPSSITYIGYQAFDYCNSLTSITIPSSVTYIGDHAFVGCRSLTSVTLSRRTQVEEYTFPTSARITYSD